MALANYRSTTQYEWSREQARGGKFETAKRRLAKKLRGKLPSGWCYKIIAPYSPDKVKWEIKMDYQNAPWITMRWRPCLFGKDSPQHYWLSMIVQNVNGDASFEPMTKANMVMQDLPIILQVVQDIFDGMNPDPLMELRAAAKKATVSFSPGKEGVEA